MIEIIPNWHPLFVHFTVALFTLSIIFFVVQRPLAETGTGDNFLIFARYSLWLGVFFGAITLVAGFDAYNTVDHDTPSHIAMTDHKNWGIATFSIFLIAAIWWKIVDGVNEKASVAFLAFILIAGGLLVTTGHKGSILVYQFGLGVQSLPAKDDHQSGGGHGHGHGHDHGSGSVTEKVGDGHGHDHSAMEGHHDVPAAKDMSKQKPPVADDDMKMDDFMMEPEASVTTEKLIEDVKQPAVVQKEVIQKERVSKAVEKAKAAPVLASELVTKSIIKSVEPRIAKKPVEVVVDEAESLVGFESDDANTFLIPSGETDTVSRLVVEKYEDGSIREVLPEVALDLQEE